jgi:hypothetical protein
VLCLCGRELLTLLGASPTSKRDGAGFSTELAGAARRKRPQKRPACEGVHVTARMQVGMQVGMGDRRTMGRECRRQTR